MKPSTIIILILLAGIAVMIFLWPSSDTSDREKDLDRENTELLYKIDSMARWYEVRLTEVKQDSVRGVQIQDSLRTQGNTYRREVQRLKENPVVIRVREEVPEVDSLIVAMDSVNVIQGHRIDAYEHQLGKLQISMVGITANFESMLSAERTRYANAQKIIDLKNKEIRKQKKKTVGAVIIGGLATVGALLIN